MGGLGEDSAAAPRPSAPRVWSFAGCVLDERSLELKVQGEIAALERKPLEVLIHLLRHAGEVVTKDELAEAVWPGRIITDSNLTKTMAVLRAALGDSEATVIKTVHGYGYRLMAPVSVQAHASEPAPARFDFKPGENPPLRPHWQLSSRLGAGGHGEVWLAHHSKTKEPRVFKFAEGGGALTALKREITLNRLLRETLPGREDYLRLLDWNFDEPPFFVESEYAVSGSLAAWAESQGGFACIPLATRLDLLAQAAEALAAAHSVGVLHKDLKPTNILVVAAPHPNPLPASGEREEYSPLPTDVGRGRVPSLSRDAGEGQIRIKLADFGSGGVLDSGALEALGITAMGFTQMGADDTTSGTPLYLAPEVLAGQPFTVQSDIYALGVMLYQLVAGDTHKSLAPGWEKDVADDLLREDIALAAAGNPADRLGDAALLAQRLRTLDQRRRQRAAERAAQVKAEKVEQAYERFRARRAWMFATLGVLLIGLSASMLLYLDARRARDHALVAEADAKSALLTAKAVTDFLAKDLLASADPNKRATGNLTARELLDIAAGQVDQRFAEHPQAAAEVHYSLGWSYRGLGLLEQSRTEHEKAVALFEKLEGRDSEQTLAALDQVGVAQKMLGDAIGSLATQQEVLERYEKTLPSGHSQVLLSRLEVAALRMALGEWEWSAAECRKIIEGQIRNKVPADHLRLTQHALAVTLAAMAEYDESEKLYRHLLSSLEKNPAKQYLLRPRVLTHFASLLLIRGRYDEAAQILSRLQTDAREQFAAEHVQLGSVDREWAQLQLEQGQFKKGTALLHSLLQRESNSPDVLWRLADAYERAGRYEESVSLWRRYLAVEGKLVAGDNPHTIVSRVGLANALRGARKPAEAWKALNSISPVASSRLPARHPHEAERRRAQGLLWILEGKQSEAREALAGTLQIYESRLGPEHWRTKRAQDELARVSAPQPDS